MQNKNPWIWEEKCLICVFLGYNLKIQLSYLKSSNLSYWTGILKNYCHIWNQHPWICLIAKFHEKIKIPKIGTKNALFGYFWAEIWRKYCHIWNQRRQICLIAKFSAKIKILKFGIKNACSFISGLEFESNIIIFEISILEFV